MSTKRRKTEAGSDAGGGPRNEASSAGPRVRSKKELYKAPTAAELRGFREGEDLFKSNLFRLQVTELLSEVRVSDGKRAAVDAGLHALKKALTGLKSAAEAVEVDRTTIFKGGVKPPLGITPEAATLIRYQFVKPAKVAVVGSYLLKAVAKPMQNVDVAVEMSAELFTAKDHMNHRYFHQRACFLGSLAAALKTNKAFTDVEFSHAQGNPLRPILVLRPAPTEGQKKTKFRIRIHPTVAASTFAVRKLAPDRNCVRRGKSADLLPPGTAAAAEGAAEAATPRYNAMIVADMLMAHHLELLHTQLFAKVPAAADAAMLTKTWLRQREMTGDAFGAFNGFAASMLMLHLLQIRKISPESSSFQIFRALVAFIADSDWRTEGVRMKFKRFSDDFPTAAFIPQQPAYQKAFDVAFVDPSGFLNILAHMTVGAYLDLRHEATLATALLDDPSTDGFVPLFMTPVNFHTKFDLTVVCDNVAPAIARRYPSQLLDRAADWEAFSMSFTAAITRRALGDRARLVTAKLRVAPRWAVEVACPSSATVPVGSAAATTAVTLGLLLDSANAARRLELGPPGDHTKEVASFRDFWGTKSELRRFPDGSVMEAVLWDVPQEVGRYIPQQIVRHALQRHARLDPETVGVTTSPCEEAITAAGSEHDSSTVDSRAAINALNGVLKQLKAEGTSLPLSINSLQGVSPAFRYSEPFPTAASEDASAGWPEWVPAYEVLLRFETSSQWPDDVEAISKVKTAFYLRLGRIFKGKMKAHAVPTQHHVDLFVRPYAFRIMIHCPKELQLVEAKHASLGHMISAAGGQGGGADIADLEVAHAAYGAAAGELDRFYVQVPAVALFAHATQMQHGSYSSAVRLAKRWVCGHMLSDTITDEAIELLVGSLYQSPGAMLAPASADVAFARFLDLLVTKDWSADLIVVDTKESLTAADVADLRREFRESRDAFPALTILTSEDRSKSVWTTAGPSHQILARMLALARESLRMLISHIEAGGFESLGALEDPLQLFRPSLADYDVVITLKTDPGVLPRRAQALGYDPEAAASANGGESKGKYKNLSAQVTEDGDDSAHTVFVEHDPAQLYLAALRKQYGHAALFFHDRLGGASIGVVWDPQALVPHPFKAQFSQDVMPVATAPTSSGKKGKGKKGKKGGDEPQAKLNVDAIVAGFRTLGRGLVKTVTTK